jgi:hypothetical protein
MKIHFTMLSLVVVLATSSTTFAQTPPPKLSTADAVIAVFKAAGLEAESPAPLTRKDYGKAPFVCKGMRFLIPSLGEDSGGRAFYCARKADRDRLARYYTSLGEQSAELFSHVFVNPPYLVQINGDLADEQAARYEAALATLSSAIAAASPLATVTPKPSADDEGFRVEILKAGYENWGRPKAMDDPNLDNCDLTDDMRPMLKLGISLAIHNTGARPWPTGTRSIDFFKTDGSPAFSCYYDYLKDQPFPETPPNGAYMMSYLIFVERNERVGSGVFKVKGIGEVRFDIPQNLPLP